MNLSIVIPCKNEKDICEMMLETERCFPEAQIIVASDQQGHGKGWALRRGMTQVKGDVVCFIDGDLDIHPMVIRDMLPFIGEYDIVVGRKKLNGPWTRKIVTLGCRFFAALYFGLWLDTQTGVKVFKYDALRPWKNNSFAFDIEILLRAKKMGKKIKEVPVYVRRTKRMTIRNILRFIRGAFEINVD